MIKKKKWTAEGAASYRELKSYTSSPVCVHTLETEKNSTTSPHVFWQSEKLDHTQEASENILKTNKASRFIWQWHLEIYAYEKASQ